MIFPPTSSAKIKLDEQLEKLHLTEWIAWFQHRDRVWLLLVSAIVVLLLLCGSHALSCGGCHSNVSSCGSSSADAALAVFYIVYILGWIMVSAAGG